ncbi:MAG: hypothetical protein J0M17_06120 [Planctomycetes bacterium]|nr:hypothetical protein [Planctomycetota bacterium]
MHTNNRLGTPDSNDDKPPFRLPEHVAQRCDELANMDGNQTDMIVQIAQSAHDAEYAAPRTEAERRLESTLGRKDRLEKLYREAWSRLTHTERLVQTSDKLKIGIAGLLKLGLTFGMIAFFIWIENGAAAQAVLATGGFDVTTFDGARRIMLTPVIIGSVLAWGMHRLPISLQNRSVYLALGVLAVVALVYAIAFADQAESYREQAGQSISLGDDGSTDEAAMIAAPEQDSRLSAWLMFCALTITMMLTAFIGETMLEHVYRSFYTWEPNPEYMRATDDVQTLEQDMRRVESQVVQDAACLAQIAAKGRQQIAQAISLYKYLKHQAVGQLLLMLGMLLTSGCASLPGPGPADERDPWAVGTATRRTAVTRVLGLSPVLPAADKAPARQELEQMLVWLADEAPAGSIVVVIDALDCVPVAKFEAVPGVARIRKKSFARPAAQVRAFLEKPRPRMKDDGRINLPRLAQTARQWRLPAGSHVAVCGNPLFLNEGKDSLFSMAGGRVPSDGCLFENPQLNIYSVVGREKALAGTFWHLGWGDDGVFEDDTHRQAVLRFWSLFFSEQGATLVTAQRSISTAIAGARDAETEPLTYDEPDRDAEAAMVKTVKVLTESKETIEPKKSDRDAVPKAASPPAKPTGTTSTTTARDAALTDAARDVQAEHRPLEKIVRAEHQARDLHGNLSGETHDLIARGQMHGRKVLVVQCYYDAEVAASPLYKALRDKGYQVHELRVPLPAPAEFETLLDGADQVWLFSSKDHLLPRTHIQSLTRRWRDGTLALCLLADNAPFSSEATDILDAIAPGSRITGDYQGERKLARRHLGRAGFDDASPLFHNVDALYEGTTISSVSGPKLSSVCYASNGLPLIATCEQPGSRRLLVHCGFTSFFPRYWDDAGVARFAVNAAGWLSDADAAGTGQK